MTETYKKRTVLQPRRLDIEELNYETSSEPLGVLKHRPHPWWRRSAAIGAAVFVVKGVRAVLNYRSGWADEMGGTTVLAPVSSLNQYRAISPVLDRVKGARVLSLHSTVPGPRFPDAESYIASVLYFPHTLWWAIRSRGYRRLGYSRFFERYWLTFGYVAVAERVLRAVGPRLVLLANDHMLEARAFAYAAHHLGIPTVYMQHASVTNRFPALNFDFAFLDGADAAEKYDLPTDRPVRIYLAGIPKADVARTRARRAHVIRSIGVCVNTLDPIDHVCTFVETFRRLAPDIDVVLRPHPSDHRRWRSAIDNVQYSDARIEPPFDFLHRVDAVVTGPSSIVLEAALLGTAPLYVDFAGSDRDPYGFVQGGLCKQVRTAEDVLSTLKTDEPPLDAAVLNRFCATVSTEYDGRSSHLVAELIEEILRDEIDHGRWKQRDGFRHIDVYELRRTSPITDRQSL